MDRACAGVVVAGAAALLLLAAAALLTIRRRRMAMSLAWFALLWIGLRAHGLQRGPMEMIFRT